MYRRLFGTIQFLAFKSFIFIAYILLLSFTGVVCSHRATAEHRESDDEEKILLLFMKLHRPSEPCPHRRLLRLACG